MHFDTEVVFLERNDRNNTDDIRRAQSRQSFHRNPQRPPSPDYRRQQADNSEYERVNGRERYQENASRMNQRTGQNTRVPERRFELPDRPQQGRDVRDAVLNGAGRSQERFVPRDGGGQSRQNAGERRTGTYPSAERQETRRDNAGFRRNSDSDSRQRAQSDYSRSGDAQRTGRRFEPRDTSREPARQTAADNRERQRDSRRFEAREPVRTQENRRERPESASRNTHDEEYYNSPRATDPRGRGNGAGRYDGMNEGNVDLRSFDINYKGDSTGRGQPAARGISGKPLMIGIFAISAVVITVIIFAVISGGNKKGGSDSYGTGREYEVKIPDSVKVGGTEIKTDSDYIELAGMNISDISDLSYCYLVNSLFINGNSITDITPLGDCISLKTLDANSNSISDITALSNLNQLSDLDLSGNQITDISPLSRLRQLERFSAGKNSISDISPLSGCQSLRQLIISDNQISDLTPVAGLSNLTTLEIANNQITDILALSGLSNLSTLNLSGNSVTDIKALKTLSSLTMLDLSGNPVSDVSTLSSLKGLLELNLSGTKVSKEDIADLKKALPDCQVRK